MQEETKHSEIHNGLYFWKNAGWKTYSEEVFLHKLKVFLFLNWYYLISGVNTLEYFAQPNRNLDISY